MIKRAELKSLAKQQLKGNWGTAICALLLYSVIVGALSATGVGSLFTGVLTAGYVAVFMAIIRDGKTNLETLFSGLTGNFVTNFVAGLLVSIFTALWTLLFIVPGIVKGLAYSMTFYVLRDNPNMSATEAITESRRIMDGHKGQLFVLYLSFIGWLLLSALTFGILLLYVTPYMDATVAAFYDAIKPAPAAEEQPEVEQATEAAV